MPTPISLVDDLAKRIEGVVKLYRHGESDSPESLRSPTVFRQYLPAKRYEGVDLSDYPFVVVALGEYGIDSFEARPTAEVMISCGGYDDGTDNQGWRIPTDVATRIMVDLQRDPVMGEFMLEFPLTMTYPDTQPSPQWLSFIYTRWTMPNIGVTTPDNYYREMFGETPPRAFNLGVAKNERS